MHRSPVTLGVLVWFAAAAALSFEACSDAATSTPDPATDGGGVDANVPPGPTSDASPSAIDASDAATVADGGSDPCARLAPTPLAVTCAPGGGPCATQLSAGVGHVCALLSDKTVSCWGNNADSECGRPSSEPFVQSPSPILGLSGVTQLTSGWYHSCALVATGEVRCWGRLGALGDGGPAPQPVTVSLPGVARRVVGGGYHTCAELTDGKVYCWGANDRAQSGKAPAPDDAGSFLPVVVPQLTSLADVCAFDVGGRFACGADADGGTRCFGDNKNGELGRGADASVLPFDPTPGAVVGLPAATKSFRLGRSVAYGEAAVVDGELWTWGQNLKGEATPDTTSSPLLTPVRVSGFSEPVIAAGTGNSASCALLASGAVACFGGASRGVLGQQDDAGSFVRPTPVPGVADAVQVVVGWIPFACALRKNGSVSCWGDNFYGQLGRAEDAGALPYSSTPAPVVF
ncbi:MAG: hypothetical protein KC657_39775 [Myxococcales bacterium]|nr:hypothetical protein [Myxococcales bacterium]